MGNPLKQIVCHFTFVLFILSVVQASFFYGLPKQVLGLVETSSAQEKNFNSLFLGEKNQYVVSEEYWSHL